MDTALRIVHLLAAIVWTGGTIALVFVSVPPVQRLEGEARGLLLREFGEAESSASSWSTTTATIHPAR